MKRIVVFMFILVISVFGKPIKNGLEPVLVIGGRSGKGVPHIQYDFGFITQVRWDASGNIYAFDSKDKCVHVFDSSGRFLRKMFSSGQGPEELSNPMDIAINSVNKELYVLQNWGYGIKVFQLDGRLKRLVRLKKQIFLLGDVVDSNCMVVVNPGTGSSETVAPLLLLDLKSGRITRRMRPFDGVPGVNLDQRVCVYKGKAWTATKERFEVRAYDLKTGKLAITCPVQGKFRKNSVLSFVQSGRRGYSLVIRTAFRPVVLNNHMWLLVSLRSIPDHPKEQEVLDSLDEAEHYLYKLEGGEFRKVTKIDQANGMQFLNVNSKRGILAFSSEDPDFHLTFFKFQE